MTVREWLLENWSNHERKEALALCCAQLNVTYRSASEMYAKIKKTKLAETNGTCEVIGLSIDDMRARYDAIYKITNAVKEIPKGKFVPEQEFREKLVKCDPGKFRSKACLEQFSKYKGYAKGITFWGNSDDIQRLKDEGILS